ncbi:MAG: hypothetical protein AABW79_04375 [Nanoarchaeota archaeon]
MPNFRPEEPKSLKDYLGSRLIPANAPHYLGRQDLLCSLASAKLESQGGDYICTIPLELEGRQGHAKLWPFLVNRYNRFVNFAENPFLFDSEEKAINGRWRVIIVNPPSKSRKLSRENMPLGEVVLLRKTIDTDHALLPKKYLQYMLERIMTEKPQEDSPEQGLIIENPSAENDYNFLSRLYEKDSPLIKSLADTARLQRICLPMLPLETPRPYRK